MENHFLEPFRKELWWAITILAIILWGFLCFMVVLEKHYIKELKDSQSTLHTHTQSETLLITSAALCQQGKISLALFFSYPEN